MNPFSWLVLPQNDTPDNRAKRQQVLAEQQALYRFDYDTKTLAGLPMAAAPIPVELSLVWAAQVAEVAIALGENLLNIVLPNFVDFDIEVPLNVGSGASGALEATRRPAGMADALTAQSDGLAVQRAAEGGSGAGGAGGTPGASALAIDAAQFKRKLDEARAQLAGLAAAASAVAKPAATVAPAAVAATAAPAAPAKPAASPMLGDAIASVGKRVVGAVEGAIERAIAGVEHAVKDAVASAERVVGDVERAAETAAGAAGAAEIAIEQRVVSWLEDLLHEIAAFLGKLYGVYGRPTDLEDYQRQFHTLPLPASAAVLQSDEAFAQLRVAGPNPVVLRRATAGDIAGLALGDHAAAIADALRRGALFIADYSALAQLQPGTIPAQKYVYTPKALFEVPSAGRRALRPVAIQTGSAAPVVFPGDGTAWEIAKLIVNMADGNYHELISHLGLTHLVTEPFAITTHRQLDPKHPLYALLAPHFAGTLLINYAAQTLLIGDGGAVDKLLTGTIESSRAVSATAVQAVRYNETFLPLALAARGVDDPAALPDYPYRDDAMALWNAIHTWVTAYLAIYYPTPADVTGDYELQAWVAELASEHGGRIQDIGERGAPRIETTEYLAQLVTQVIFTASVQHAAVNFPQRTIMSYTPAMPLAAYAPFPAPSDRPPTQVLDMLPPLQMGLLQQTVGTALGGVYHTVLGQYGGELATVQLGDALPAFQRALQAIELDIQRKTVLGERTPYTTLLPSRIPQSINI